MTDPTLIQLKLRRFERLRRQWAIAGLLRWGGGALIVLNWGFLLILDVQTLSPSRTLALIMGMPVGLITLLVSFPYQWWLRREIGRLFPKDYQPLWEDLNSLEVSELLLAQINDVQWHPMDELLKSSQNPVADNFEDNSGKNASPKYPAEDDWSTRPNLPSQKDW